MKNLIKILALTLAMACCFTACGKGEKNEVSKLVNRSYDEVYAELSKDGLEKIDTKMLNFTQPYTAKAPTAAQKANMRRAKILLMGDSWTQGGGASTLGSFFYSALTDMGGYFELVGQNKYGTPDLDEHYIRHCGGGGWTVEKLQTAYNNNIKDKIDYDIAIIHIGLNDGYGQSDVELYAQRYDKLMADVFADNPDAIVYLVSVHEGELDQNYTAQLSEKVKLTAEKYAKAGKNISYLHAPDYYNFKPDENFITYGPGNRHPNHIGNQKIATAYAMAVAEDVLEINKNPALEGADKVIDPTSVTISKNELNLKIDQQKTLTWEVAPKGNEVSNIIWSSSDPYVVTVNFHGLVTAVAAGEATITARIPGTEIKAECKVKVSSEKFELSLPENEILNEDFSYKGNWNDPNEVIDGGYVKVRFQAIDFSIQTKESYSASKNSASLQFSNRMTMLVGQKPSKTRWFKVFWGDYRIETNDNWATTDLYYKDDLLGRHTAHQRADYEETFTLKFENGKVLLYIGNELVARADAPADPSGKIIFDLHKPTIAGGFYLDNLIIKG
ncbi:MAG: Ig-like domain-containing protein [Clostridia bacterium]|nr:Ig-like domain-containing protein [Clostridia bacterium]